MKDETGSGVSTAQRRLAAVMFTDIVGFSRQMGANETRMLRILAVHNQVIEQAVAEHHGHVIKTMGDAFVVDFPSVVHAVQCAQHVQKRFRHHNAQAAQEEQIHVRIGIHLGDIIQQDGDVLGDGVNIASRLQTLTEPDTICISQAVYQEVEKKLPLGTVVSLGRPHLKNIAQRFQVYALLSEAPQGVWQRLQVQRLKLSHRVRPMHRLVVAGLFLITGTLVTVRYFPFPVPNSELGTPNSQPLPLPDKPSIVVLPFANMSDDSGQDYFSDGITEVLTSDLSRIASLFVIARNTAFTYKGKPANVQDVGRDLGVRYVLEGSVQKAGEQVRIVAQLIDTTTGGHLWSERYDRPLKDIFTLQDEIVQKIVTTLQLQLTLWEQGWLARKRTDNLEAYDYFLRGVISFRLFTKEGNIQARQMYEKAIELDPQYAQAYAALGATYFAEWWTQWSPNPQALERWFALSQKAVALDDTLSAAHRHLGSAYLWKRQYEKAIAEAERAIALDSNDAENYTTLADILTYAGRAEETIGLMERAMRLNPRHPFNYWYILGRAYFLTGRTEEAIATVKEARTRNPNNLGPHLLLATIYSEVGQEAEAQAEAAEVLRISPDFSLEMLKQRSPFKDPTVVERALAAARRAGLK